jgi:predicted kinase
MTALAPALRTAILPRAIPAAVMEHPIVSMFHEEVRLIVNEFSDERIRTPPRDRRSLVIILRGLPGCGKSTFATFLKLYAESIGLEAQVCSADSYFMTRQGYKFNPSGLGEAHARCQAYCFQALIRGVPVVIIDNTNVTYSEWTRYVSLAREGGHAFCRVSFEGNLQVQELLARSWHDVPERAMNRCLQLFYEHNDMYAAHYTVAIRQDVFAAQDTPMLDRAHPMELMFFELIRERIDAFVAFRATATGWDALQSLVFVLRGLPGCGKTTFALQTRRLDTLICSSDDVFRKCNGVHG